MAHAVPGARVVKAFNPLTAAVLAGNPAKALAAGERNLRELKQSLDATGDRRTGSGSTPVFRK